MTIKGKPVQDTNKLGLERYSRYDVTVADTPKGKIPQWTNQGRVNDSAIIAFRPIYAGAFKQHNGELFNAYINPNTFSVDVNPQYSVRSPLGLSHQTAQYVGTDSREISMDLLVSWHIYVAKGFNPDDVRNPLDLRNFFESLSVPSGPRGAPPRVEIVWPKVHLYFTGVVTSMSTTYQRLAKDSSPLEYTVSLTLLETPAGPMYSPIIRKYGLGYSAKTTLGSTGSKTTQGPTVIKV